MEHAEGDNAWIEDLSPEEIVREIDQEAKERLGMTFEEFVGAYGRGVLEDTTATNELVISLRLVEHQVLIMEGLAATDEGAGE